MIIKIINILKFKNSELNPKIFHEYFDSPIFLITFNNLKDFKNQLSPMFLTVDVIFSLLIEIFF